MNVLAPEEKGIQEPGEESQTNSPASFLLLLYPYISLPCSHPFFPSVVNGTCLQKLGKEVLPEGLSHSRSEGWATPALRTSRQVGLLIWARSLDGFRMCAAIASLAGFTYAPVSSPVTFLNGTGHDCFLSWPWALLLGPRSDLI